MGNDGGTVASRTDILNLHRSKTDLNKTTFDDKPSQYTICGLSGITLKDKPVMSDYKGDLFSKEQVLNYVLSKKYKDKNSKYSHIRGLNDLVDVKPVYSDDSRALVCPISGASVSFCYSRLCGCIVSYKLITDLSKAKVTECPNCGTQFKPEHIVILNPTKNDTFSDKNNQTYQLLKQNLLSHSTKRKKRHHHNNNNNHHDNNETQTKKRKQTN